MRRVATIAPLLAVTMLATACVDAHPQSPLNVAGDGARGILHLWRWLLAISSVIYVVVIGIALFGLFRKRRGDDEPRRVSTTLWVGVGGVAIPAIVLTFILILTLRTLSAEAALDRSPADMHVKVIAKQFWWDIHYDHPEPQSRLRTANELHIPVGRTVRVELESRDVVHSFWVPALEGKIDVVPGRRNYLTLRATQPGVYRGQCSEYCGMQHANMAFLVIAQDSADFDAWYRHELTEAPPPATPRAQEGMKVFLEKPCAMCHEVRGTRALATVGPDLTHLASRRTLAAGTLPNNRGSLAGWILNPQSLKPGAHMPDIELTSYELHSLLAFLETLR